MGEKKAHSRQIMAVLKQVRHRCKILSARAQDMVHRSEEPLPFPPPHLRFRVHGALDRASFAGNGQRITRNLLNILSESGYPPDGFGHILDFGCGCGRTLRYFAAAVPGARLSGADIDRENLDWCRRNFPEFNFSHNDQLPPMDFPDNQFDLIIGVSVFTHLPQDLQNVWLAELRRVSRKGALLLLSVHNGKFAAKRLAPELHNRLEADGFLYLVPGTGRSKLDGLPDYYQLAFHTRPYINRHWGKYFEIIDIIDDGIGGIQDAVLLKCI